MTDDKPTYVTVDRTLDKAVEHLTRIYLRQQIEGGLEALHNEEAEDEAPLLAPILTSDGLRAFLVKELGVEAETANPMRAAYASGLISTTVISMLTAVIALDAAMYAFLRGHGVISTTVLYVNDPVVYGALEARPPAPDEVMLHPIGDFYTEQQIPGDDRRDVVIGAIAWKGVYICRPALVNLEDIEDRFLEADEADKQVKPPTIKYVPRYGTH